MHHISEEEFRLIKWLPTSKRIGQCMKNITYNFVNNTCPYYLSEVFEFAPHCKIDKRNNFSKLENTFRKTNMEQKKNFILVSLLASVCMTHLKKRIV